MQLKDLTPYLKQANHPIETDEDLANATSLLSELNRRMDAVTEDKEKLTKPLNASLKAIREKYKPLESALQGAIDQLRTSLTSYAQAQSLLAKEQEQKILEDKRTTPETKMTKLANLPTTVDKVATDQGKVTFTTVTKYRLVSAGDTPIQLLEINLPALKEYLKAGNPLPKGIKVYEEQSLRNYR